MKTSNTYNPTAQTAGFFGKSLIGLFGQIRSSIVTSSLSRLVCVMTLAVLWGLAGKATAALSDFQVFNYYFNGASTPTLPGRLFIPLNYDPNVSYPIVVFYHGSSEVGTNNTSQVLANIGNLLANAKTRNFFLYAPQATSSPWNETHVDNSMRMLSNATRLYNIDTSRMYVTGLSLGGGGAWSSLLRYSGALAAGVPICAVPPDSSSVLNYSNLVGKPIWAFHAVNDGTVSVANTRNAVNAIRAADGGKPALSFPLNNSPTNPYYNTGAPHYTDGSTFYSENNLQYSEYASGGHPVWGRTYNFATLYTWMLAQSVPASTSTLQVGETMFFDFGGTRLTVPDSLGRRWNGTTDGYQNTQSAILPFGVTSQNRSTSVSLDVSQLFTGPTASGSTAAYGNGLGTDGWYVNGNGKLLIRGLIPAATYRLQFYGSTSNTNSVTRYQVGAQFVDLDTTGNTTNTVWLNSLAADASGNIEVSVAPVPGSTSIYGQINTMRLTSTQTANQAPAISVGPNQTIVLPNTAILSGEVNDDGLPIAAAVTTQWSKVSGPGNVSFSNASSLQTVASFSQAGTYVLRLTAQDTELSNSRDVQITVQPGAGVSQYLFDFGDPAILTSAPNWNNVTTYDVGLKIANAVDANGGPSSVSLTMSAAFSGMVSAGTTTGGPYPGTATQDAFYTQNAAVGKLRLDGLSAANTYTLKLYASRLNGTDNRVTAYTVGASTVTMDVANNVTNFVTLPDLVPTSGSIEIEINNTTGVGYGYIGVLDVTAVPVSGTTLTFAAATSSGSESVTSVPLTVNRTGSSAGAVGVSYSITGGSATSADRTLANGTLAFAAGETSKTIPLVVVNDTNYESSETVIITLSAPTGGATLGANVTHTYTILDNDGVAPAITSTAPPNAVVGQPYSYVVTLTGTPSPTLSVSGQPAWLSLSGNTLAGTPTVAGSFGPITLTAANGVNPVATQTFTLIVTSTYESWRQTIFNAAQLADPNISGSTADPDGDGQANLLEYAVDSNPLIMGGSAVFIDRNPEGYLTLTFLRARSELTYEVLGSSNLTTWSTLASNPGAVGEIVTITDSVGPVGKRFLRLRVNLP